jgi:hypothetical protein
LGKFRNNKASFTEMTEMMNTGVQSRNVVAQSTNPINLSGSERIEKNSKRVMLEDKIKSPSKLSLVTEK